MAEKVLICGSRDWGDAESVESRVEALPRDTILIEGEARGVDRVARSMAEDLGMFVVKVPCEDIHWKLYGRSAGHRRNAAMLALGPDLVIAFQRNESNGTQGTIDRARELGIPVEVHRASPAPVPSEREDG